jgi:hypothetical protein
MRAIILSALILAGCSTVPVQNLKVTGNTIVVTRDSGFQGSACSYTVLVNGVEQFPALRPGARMLVSGKSGENTVIVQTASQTGFGGFCPNVRLGRTVTLDNSPKYFRMGMAAGQIFFEENPE